MCFYIFIETEIENNIKYWMNKYQQRKKHQQHQKQTISMSESTTTTPNQPQQQQQFEYQQQHHHHQSVTANKNKIEPDNFQNLLNIANSSSNDSPFQKLHKPQLRGDSFQVPDFSSYISNKNLSGNEMYANVNQNDTAKDEGDEYEFLPSVMSILNNKEKTNSVYKDDHPYYHNIIDKDQAMSRKFLDEHKHVIRMQKAHGKADWEWLKKQHYEKNTMQELETVDPQLSFLPCQSEKEFEQIKNALELDAVQKRDKDHPIPEFISNFGHAFTVQYPGVGDCFSLNKWYFRSKEDANFGKAEQWRVFLKLRSIPSMILALQDLYFYATDKLHREGKTPNLAENYPTNPEPRKEPCMSKIMGKQMREKFRFQQKMKNVLNSGDMSFTHSNFTPQMTTSYHKPNKFSTFAPY